MVLNSNIETTENQVIEAKSRKCRWILVIWRMWKRKIYRVVSTCCTIKIKSLLWSIVQGIPRKLCAGIELFFWDEKESPFKLNCNDLFNSFYLNLLVDIAVYIFSFWIKCYSIFNDRKNVFRFFFYKIKNKHVFVCVTYILILIFLIMINLFHIMSSHTF